VTWRKASHSTESSNCVEIAGSLDRLRDSKNPDGPVLNADIAALIRAVRASDFDQL